MFSMQPPCSPCLRGEYFLIPHNRPGQRQGCLELLALLTTSSRTSVGNDSENLVLAHDQKVFTVDLDFRAAVLAKQNAVALLNIQGLTRAVFLVFPLAGRDYFAFLRFFFRAVRDDDAAANLLAFFNALHDHAVM